jgi:hypothetical protein
MEAASGQPYVYGNASPVNYVDPSGNIAWFAAIGIAWAAAEFGLTVGDGVNTTQTLFDPNVSAGDKAIAGGLFLAGVIGPGAGYSTIARGGGKAADDWVFVGSHGASSAGADDIMNTGIRGIGNGELGVGFYVAPDKESAEVFAWLAARRNRDEGDGVVLGIYMRKSALQRINGVTLTSPLEYEPWMDTDFGSISTSTSGLGGLQINFN